jgi:hypothetical protein
MSKKKSASEERKVLDEEYLRASFRKETAHGLLNLFKASELFREHCRKPMAKIKLKAESMLSETKKIWFNLFFVYVITIGIIFGCASADSVITNKTYPPTDTVELYIDMSSMPNKEYVEIGFVEAKGSAFGISKTDLLDEMVAEAKSYGADALIKIEFFDQQYTSWQYGTYDKPRSHAMMIKYKSNIKPTIKK